MLAAARAAGSEDMGMLTQIYEVSTAAEAAAISAMGVHHIGVLVGDGSDPWVMAQADLDRAVGFVAGTDNDTTNLALVAAARRATLSAAIA